MTLADARHAFADWVDPGRTDRETAAIKRALAYRDVIRKAKPLILVSEHRELRGIIPPMRRNVIVASVDEATAGRIRGHVISSVTPTNLALQHTDYHRAIYELQSSLLTTWAGA